MWALKTRFRVLVFVHLLPLSISHRFLLPLGVLLECSLLARSATEGRSKRSVVVRYVSLGRLQLFLRWHRRVFHVRLFVREEVLFSFSSFTEWRILQQGVMLFKCLSRQLLLNIVVIRNVRSERRKGGLFSSFATDLALLSGPSLNVRKSGHNESSIRISEPLRVGHVSRLLHPLDRVFLGSLRLLVTVWLELGVMLDPGPHLVFLDDLLASHLERIADRNIGRFAKQRRVRRLALDLLIGVEIASTRYRFASLIFLGVLLGCIVCLTDSDWSWRVE